MGLFDFIKSAGKKLFKKEDAAASANAESAEGKSKIQLINEALKGELARFDLALENEDVIFANGTVLVYGKAQNQETREKVILALGNVEGVERVDDRIEVEEPAPEAVFHTVASGDSLSKISKQYYNGDPMKYNAIFEANKPMLKSVDMIYPGQVLRIPNLG